MARSSEPRDAMALLKRDHDKVKELFDAFEDAGEDAAAAKKIADEAIQQLKIHSAIEEEIFYPALRQRIQDDEGIMDEADEEHHAAKVLIAELELMSGEEEHYCAKFWVLAENVRHHIKEEEREMFKKAKKSDVDFKALGERLKERKNQLAESGLPELPEEQMVKQAGVRGDSTARKAQASIAVPIAETRKGRKTGHPAAMGLMLAGTLAAAARAQGPIQVTTTTPNAPPTNQAPTTTPPSNAPNAPGETVTPGQPNANTPSLQGGAMGPGSEGGPSGSRMGGPEDTRGPGDSAGSQRQDRPALSDRQTSRLVKDSLEQENTRPRNLRVSTKNGIVTIRGSVASQDDKDALGARAAAIVGAETVQNELIVR